MNKKKAVILVVVMIMMTFLSLSVIGIISYTSEEMNLTQLRTEDRRTLYKAMEIASRVKYAIDYSPYDAMTRNTWLVNYAPAGVGQNATYADPKDSTSTYTVQNLGNYWYEIRVRTPIPGTASPTIYKEVSFRVEERTSLSDYQLFVHNGAVVADGNRWYGKVHSNSYINFRNMVPGLGAKFYDKVSYVTALQDYSESGGVNEASFYGGTEKVNPIAWPEISALNELSTIAQAGITETWNIVTSTGGTGYGQLKRGAGGIYISKGTNLANVQINFVNNETNPAQKAKVQISIKDSAGNPLIIQSGTTRINIPLWDVPMNELIYAQGEITSLTGELNGRVSVVTEGNVWLPADLQYEDNYGQKPYIYNPAGGDNDFIPNPLYKGDSVLGVISANNILFTGATDTDLNLILNGYFATGVGTKQSDFYWGSFRWWQTYPDYNNKENLRLYGSIISYGYHYKGWGSAGGGWAGGYKTSAFAYDRLKPPHFLTIKKPAFAGWRIQNAQ
jgi:hypothetical protein